MARAVKTVETIKSRIRVSDTVQVISGKESGRRRVAEGEDESLRGRRGKVLAVDRVRGRATVRGLNNVYKHQKQSQDPNRPNVGRIQVEAPIQLSNLMLVCPQCDEATRIGIRIEAVEREGGKTKQKRRRVCKKCNADIPEK